MHCLTFVSIFCTIFSYSSTSDDHTFPISWITNERSFANPQQQQNDSLKPNAFVAVRIQNPAILVRLINQLCTIDCAVFFPYSEFISSPFHFFLSVLKNWIRSVHSECCLVPRSNRRSNRNWKIPVKCDLYIKKTKTKMEVFMLQTTRIYYFLIRA